MSGTLSDWNKRLEKDGLTKDLNAWARKLTPNVMFALYKNIIKSGRAHEVRAWFEIVENQLVWNQLNLEEINSILSDTLRKVVNREISHKQASMIAKLASTLSKQHR
jgi:hypothetical protein